MTYEARVFEEYKCDVTDWPTCDEGEPACGKCGRCTHEGLDIYEGIILRDDYSRICLDCINELEEEYEVGRTEIAVEHTGIRSWTAQLPRLGDEAPDA